MAWEASMFSGADKPLTYLILVENVNKNVFNMSYRPMPWRDSISRPMAPVSSVAGGYDTITYVDHTARADMNA
jgi:hypothetical protein